jgi:hypothetical protein
MRTLRNSITLDLVKRLINQRKFDLVKTVNGNFFDGVLSNAEIGIIAEGNIWDCDANRPVTSEQGAFFTTSEIVYVGFIDSGKIHYIETVTGHRYAISDVKGDHPISQSETILVESLQSKAKHISESLCYFRNLQWSDPLTNNKFSLSSNGDDVTVHRGLDHHFYAMLLDRNQPLLRVSNSDLKYPSPIPF